jgi:hypothetical protein
MIVKELKTELDKFDDGLEVRVDINDYIFHPAPIVKVLKSKSSPEVIILLDI